MQSRGHSFVESVTQVVAGAVVSWLFTYYALPALWNLQPSPTDALGITLTFMAISLARTYIIRRIGNAWAHRT